MPAVLYLDRYHLGDPLFLTGFARDVLASPEPLVIVHGSGEAAERALEAQGRIAEWHDGVLAVETGADRALVERAARTLNRQIAHALNEAGVASVRLDASSRGLLREGTQGLEVKKMGWLRTLVSQRVVPVVAGLLAVGEEPAREVNGGAVAGAIASALSDDAVSIPVLILAKKTPNEQESQVLHGGGRAAVALPDDLYGEPEVLRAALKAGAAVHLLTRADLRRGARTGAWGAEAVDNKSA